MSYNIDTVRMKRMENFIIPMEALYDKSLNKNWLPENPEIIDAVTNEIIINMGCEQSITGILKDGKIHVKEMDLSGEGSGAFFTEVLDKAFKRSTGIFEAVFVWEDGDAITKITVIDGKLTENDVEI